MTWEILTIFLLITENDTFLMILDAQYVHTHSDILFPNFLNKLCIIFTAETVPKS